MGRQHTTWIDDETWERLERIAGDSVSEKLRNAVRYCDPQQMALNNAAQARLNVAVKAIRHIQQALNLQQPDIDILQEINDVIEDCYWTVAGLE
jgi:hypothetical protein